MIRSIALVASLAAASAASAASEAAVLGAASFDQTYVLPIGPGAEPPSPPAYLIFSLGYSTTPGALEDPATRIFDQVQLTGSVLPVTITLNGATDDAQLPAFIARATNGINDEVRINIIGAEGGGVGLADLESEASAALGSSLPGPDLRGALITGFELVVDTLTINPVSAFGQEAWHIAGQVRVLGEIPTPVPLPGTVWLLAGGLPWLLRNARRVRSDASRRERI